MGNEREADQRNAVDVRESHGEVAEETRASGGGFTSTGTFPPVQSGFGGAGPSPSDRAFGPAHAHDHDSEVELRDTGDLDAKDDAERRRDQRFDNDADLEAIAAGTKVIKNGDSGRAVTKLQVALLDLGYLKGKQVDGDFGDTTEKALRKYQGVAKVPDTGEFDAATLGGLRTQFESRKPYVALSKRSSSATRPTPTRRIARTCGRHSTSASTSTSTRSSTRSTPSGPRASTPRAITR